MESREGVEVFCSAATGDMNEESQCISLCFGHVYRAGARKYIKVAHPVCSGEELP